MTSQAPDGEASPSQLLSVCEVAERLRISRGWLYSLLRQGDLPSLKIGSRVLVREAELDRWIRDHTTGGPR